MGTHVVSYYDEPDAMELVDIDYQCSASCMRGTLLENGVRNAEPAGTCNDREGGSISWGAWPGGAETDYAVFCSGCGDKLWDGMNDEG